MRQSITGKLVVRIQFEDEGRCGGNRGFKAYIGYDSERPVPNPICILRALPRWNLSAVHSLTPSTPHRERLSALETETLLKGGGTPLQFASFGPDLKGIEKELRDTNTVGWLSRVQRILGQKCPTLVLRSPVGVIVVYVTLVVYFFPANLMA